MVRATRTVADHEITIFGRLIESGSGALPPQVAQYILALDFRPEERARMHELAMKAQEGTLTAEDELQIDSYERVGHLLSIWKSKARKALKNAERGAH